MLGQTVRESRIKKGLTQAKLARLAGVSRRHLAALEKGANVSVAVLRKVATVLDLHEIRLGELSLVAGDGEAAKVNMPLLADTIRDAHSGAIRMESLLAQAEALVGGRSIPEAAAIASAPRVVPSFPRMPVRRLDAQEHTPLALVADAPEMLRIEISGELRQGEPVDEHAHDTVLLPAWLVEEGEIVFRARGEKLRDHGIEDGDLLVVELRTTGRAANGELVIAKIGDVCWVGRWWQKHGQKALMSDGLAEVTTGGSTRAMKVVAAINQIVRPA